MKGEVDRFVVSHAAGVLCVFLAMHAADILCKKGIGGPQVMPFNYFEAALVGGLLIRLGFGFFDSRCQRSSFEHFGSW